MEDSYLSLKKHYENCFKNYGDNYRGVDWPNEKDANIRYQVMTDIKKFDGAFNLDRKPKFLDFGCGLAHLYGYWKKNNIDYDYCGLDISDDFINASKQKYPSVNFSKADLMNNTFESSIYDYVVANGLFTEKLKLDQNYMWKWVKKMILKVFSMSEFGFACNFMSTNVDWEREDLFHLPVEKLISFVHKEVSESFIIRNDYKKYEYTIYIYKNVTG